MPPALMIADRSRSYTGIYHQPQCARPPVQLEELQIAPDQWVAMQCFGSSLVVINLMCFVWLGSGREFVAQEFHLPTVKLTGCARRGALGSLRSPEAGHPARTANFWSLPRKPSTRNPAKPSWLIPKARLQQMTIPPAARPIPRSRQKKAGPKTEGDRGTQAQKERSTRTLLTTSHGKPTFPRFLTTLQLKTSMLPTIQLSLYPCQLKVGAWDEAEGEAEKAGQLGNIMSSAYHASGCLV